MTDFDNIPGGDLVSKGISDLKSGIISEEALLVLIAAPRLTGLGIVIPEAPEVPQPFEHALFSEIEKRRPNDALIAYNALIQRIVSFANSFRTAT